MRVPLAVGFRPIQPQLLLYGEVLRGERLVHFDKVHLLQFHPGLGERLTGRGGRADAHVLGLDADHRPRHQPPQWLQSLRCGERFARDHRRRRAVADPRGVPGGHQTVLLEVRLQATEPLERGLGPHVLVGAELDVLALHFDGNRHDLVLEDAIVPGLLGALLGAEGDFIHLAPREFVLLRELFGGFRHREAALRVLERFPQQVFERCRGPQSQAPAGAVHDVGCLAHRFRPAAQHGLGLAEQDELSALGDGLEP